MLSRIEIDNFTKQLERNFKNKEKWYKILNDFETHYREEEKEDV